ncbi:MAG: disulfide bond formation protein B [Bradyrhizobiaceae bacterium PARB1]|jgi:disulfide bond formation protein DsbB|nr:MAG: disulfide bond formation protein B [Bradyrhizobiaceae bacterium PARB1]
MTPVRAIALNVLALYALAGILAAAFGAQFILGELPCPLCLLQRILFALLAVGPILNIRYGPRPSHYALSLLAAIVGAVVSTRQVLLHIMPGDPGYGTALFGHHFYTLALMAFVAAIALISIVLLFDRQFSPQPAPVKTNMLAIVAVGLIIALTAGNFASALLECGFKACADDPVVYELLKR